jgi:hypothetical protein
MKTQTGRRSTIIINPELREKEKINQASNAFFFTVGLEGPKIFMASVGKGSTIYTNGESKCAVHSQSYDTNHVKSSRRDFPGIFILYIYI